MIGRSPGMLPPMREGVEGLAQLPRLGVAWRHWGEHVLLTDQYNLLAWYDRTLAETIFDFDVKCHLAIGID